MSSEWDLSKAIGSKQKPYEVQIGNKEMILYSLGIGFQKQPLKTEHYDFTYEGSADFQAFPTMAVVVGHRGDLANFEVPGMPRFNPMMLLHGEERVEMHSPIEMDTTLLVEETIIDLQDKKKATVMVIETKITDKETNELKAKLFTNLFIRGIGGFGAKGTYKNAIPAEPKTQPDYVVSETTTPNQAFLYRLSGDYNPLHVDPNMSSLGGFDTPILHGLCTYGITARAVYETFHKEDPNLMQSITGRFTSHVFPGETLVVNMWKSGNQVTFITKTKERGLAVLKGSCVLKD